MQLLCIKGEFFSACGSLPSCSKANSIVKCVDDRTKGEEIRKSLLRCVQYKFHVINYSITLTKSLNKFY